MTLQSKSLADLLTVSRASVKTVVDASGNFTDIAADTPAFDYATGRRGLLLEASATRLNSYPDIAAGYTAVAWTVSDPSMTVAALGLSIGGRFGGVSVASGGNAGHRISNGSPAVTSGSVYAVIALIRQGSSPQASVTMSNPTGSTDSILTYTFAGASFAVTATLAGTFSQMVATPRADGTVLLTFLFTPNFTGTCKLGIGPGSATAGETVDLFAAQMEQGQGPTSLILSNDSAANVTRAADVPSVIDLTPFDLSGGSALAVSGRLSVLLGPYDRIAQMDTGLNTDRISLLYNTVSGGLSGYIVHNNGPARDITSPLTLGADFSMAISIDANASRLALDGVTTNSATIAFPTPTLLRLGSGQDGTDTPMSLTLYELALYPRGLTEAEMNEVTA